MYAPRLMITGKRAFDFGRKTSARRRAPSRIAISTSFSITTSWRGCDKPSRRAAPFVATSVNLDLALADEFAPRLRFRAHLIGPLLRRGGGVHRQYLLGEHRLCLGVDEDVDVTGSVPT